MAQMFTCDWFEFPMKNRDIQRQQIGQDGSEATHFAREHYNAIRKLIPLLCRGKQEIASWCYLNCKICGC